MDESIVIVSGLPRSGTSMVMKMLAAGGVNVLTDNIRKADHDNPKGYLEYEPVKNLKTDSGWLKDMKGRAVKVISHLLYYLPRTFTYKIIFIQRSMQEILESQKKMYQRIHKKADDIEDVVLEEKFNLHLKKIKTYIENKKYFSCLYVHYGDILHDAFKESSKIQAFLDRPLNIEAMSKVVDQNLYRNRSEVNG
jgi:mRNA-degrading endonuclease HigB of HigAB toxin-antitoxin module